jgi:hypothetical protein
MDLLNILVARSLKLGADTIIWLAVDVGIEKPDNRMNAIHASMKTQAALANRGASSLA